MKRITFGDGTLKRGMNDSESVNVEAEPKSRLIPHTQSLVCFSLSPLLLFTLLLRLSSFPNRAQ